MAKSKRENTSVPETPLEPLLTSDLVIITGLSGSGKLTALKAFEDLGFYAVDNLPISLVPKFCRSCPRFQKRSTRRIDHRHPRGNHAGKFSADVWRIEKTP